MAIKLRAGIRAIVQVIGVLSLIVGLATLSAYLTSPDCPRSDCPEQWQNWFEN